VYSYRPLAELPQILATAKGVGATTVWTESGLTVDGARDPKGCRVPEEEVARAKGLVESAGLNYLGEPHVGDIASELAASRHAI
jgi:hypothetical protein